MEAHLRSEHSTEDKSREKIPTYLLEEVIDTLGGMIFERDLRGQRNYIFISRKCEEFFGYTQQEFYENPNITEKTVVNDEIFIEYYKGKAKSKRNILEFAACRKDGKIRYFRSIFCSIYEKGVIIKYRGIIFDITEEVKNTIHLNQEISKNKLLEKVFHERKKAIEDLIRIQNKLQALNLVSKELYEKIKIDSLTGLYNRREFDYQLKILLNLAKKEKHCVSLIMCDVDYFKEYNDALGHYAGDVCLTKIAHSILKSCTNLSEIVCRYGGEEFSIIVYGLKENIALLAESIRKNVQYMAIPHPARESIPVTLSIGYCSILPDSTITPKRLIEHADLALYEAKNNGRNLCVQYRHGSNEGTI